MKKAFTACFAIFIMLFSLTSTVLAWERERPAGHITINARTESAATDGKASVGLGVHLGEYIENKVNWPSDGDDDVVDLRIAATANTRKIISYDVGTDYYYSWHDNLQNELGGGTLSLGDNSGSWLYMQGLKARFYGGPLSAEYDSVWVSSNGFVSFDPDSAPTDRYYPYSVPSTIQPNTFVAPFWRDLKPDWSGSITYGIVEHLRGTPPAILCFAISWNNVPDKDGNPQTFQVLIESAPAHSSKHRQSRIWVQYKSVTLNDQTTVGIEDQQGERGASYNYLNLGNEMTVVFIQSSNSAFIGSLKITLSETESSADTKIEPAGETIRGYNVILDRAVPDDQQRFGFALAGGIVLLASAFLIFPAPPIWVAAGAFMVDTFIYGGERAYDLARQQAEARLFATDGYHTYAETLGATDPDGIFCSAAVDAGFDILAYLILEDNNSEDHILQLTSQLNYVEYDALGNVVSSPTITTSINLKLNRDANNNWETARAVPPGSYWGFFLGGTDTEDYFKINANQGQLITATMFPPSNADFDMYLYSPDDDTTPRQMHDWSEMRGNGLPEYIYYTADMTGGWYIKMKKFSDSGFYGFMVNLQDPGPPPDGGGGGCPYVSTWNGSRYVLDNNLIAAAEKSNGTDVTDHYVIQKPPVQEQGKYSLLVWDKDKHSFLDRVQLVAVDHKSDVNVAVSPDGQILTYKDPIPPETAFSKYETDILNLVDAQDDQYYQGHPGDYIQLDFGSADIQDGAKLVMRTDPSIPCVCKLSIHIQTLNATGQWADITSFIPRLYWSTDIFDVSNHLPDINGDLKLRLYFTGHHKLDYVGLDTSKQGEFELHQGNLAAATHNRLGDVKDLFRNSDEMYVELLPSEQVELKFTLPTNTNEKRDFIIILEGHYFIP